MDKEPVLQVSNIGLSIGGKPFITNSSLSINKGEVVLLLGENGAGKSTLIDSILGYQPKDVSFSGEVSFEGKKVLGLASLSDQIGYAEQNEDIGFYLSGKSYIYLSLQPYLRMKEKEAKKVCLDQEEKLFKKFSTDFFDQERSTNFAGLAKKNTYHLSGGQSKVLSIIAALSRAESPLYILDEPLNNLDTNSIRVLLFTIDEMKKTGSSFLIITHCRLFKDPERVYQLSDCHIDDVTDQYKSYDCLDSIKGGCTKCL
jgi:ABC-type multidrug transport system ATPase subunit